MTDSKNRTVERAPARSLFVGPYAALAWAAVALVTLGALANRSVSTILPVATREVGGLEWFGIISSAPMLVYLVAGPTAGVLADRRGGKPVLFAGVSVFAIGVALCATAPNVLLLMLGRVFSGVGEAAFDVALVVVVAAHVPAQLRPKLFAAYSAAWLLPSAIGPQAAAWVDAQFTWRWVFGGIFCALVMLNFVLAGVLRKRPSGISAETPPQVPLRYAWLALAGGSGIVAITWIADSGRIPIWLSILVGGFSAAVALGSSLRLNPKGTLFFNRGLPAIVACSVSIGVIFEVVTAYVPLFAGEGGFPVALAGGLLTVTGFAWAVGSWLQGLTWVQNNTSDQLRLRIAFVLVGLGVLGIGSISIGFPVLVVYAIWALGGVGMGLANSTLATMRIDATPDERQGITAAGVNLLVSSGTSSIVMLMGLPLGEASTKAVLAGGGAVAVILGLVAAILAILAARTVPTRVMGARSISDAANGS